MRFQQIPYGVTSSRRARLEKFVVAVSCAVLAAACPCGLAAGAAEVTWTGAVSRMWEEGGNWSTGAKPGANDTAVFSAESNTSNFINFKPTSNNTVGFSVGSIRVEGGKWYIGTSVLAAGSQKAARHTFCGDGAGGPATVQVAAGASLVCSNAIAPSAHLTQCFVKSGAGSFSHGSLGYNPDTVANRRHWASVTYLDGGTHEYINDSYLMTTNLYLGAGVTLYADIGNYPGRVLCSPRVHLEAGSTILFYKETFDGISGSGSVSGYPVGVMTLNLQKYGPYRFDGRIGTSRTNIGAQTVVFGAQGSADADEYQFVVADAQTLYNSSSVTFTEGGAHPLKFASGIGAFYIYTLGGKKDQPLRLEDEDGKPVSIYVDRHSTSASVFPGFEYLRFTGSGSFFTCARTGWSASAEAWGYWGRPYTNDAVKGLTGTLGVFNNYGSLYVGDGNAAHDLDMSTIDKVEVQAAPNSQCATRFVYQNATPATHAWALDVPATASTATFSSPVVLNGPVSGAGTFTFKGASALTDYVSTEAKYAAFSHSENLLLSPNGGEAWVKSITAPVSGKTLTFSNGLFHTAYMTYTHQQSFLGLKIPGPIAVPRVQQDVQKAEVYLHGSSSRFTSMKIDAGSVVRQYDQFNSTYSPSGTITLDGGEYGAILMQSFHHDSFPCGASQDWPISVTERGGFLCDYTWWNRGGGQVRPHLYATIGSGAAAGNVPGRVTLSFHNQIGLHRPIATGGPVRLDSGYFNFCSDAAATSAYAAGTFFGTGDIELGGVCLNFGEASSDYKTVLAKDGQKIRAVGAALVMGRKEAANTSQTMTFGDGFSSPFAREKGGFLALCDYKSTVYRLDGTGPKFYVAGAAATVDPDTGILRDPVFGCTRAQYMGGGQQFLRYGFLTQGNDGLLTEDLNVYTEGVEGGANSVARLSVSNTNLTKSVRVAALNLEARTLTIASGVTLKVGDNDTDYPAVVLTRLNAGWNSDVTYGNISGSGTLDFGKSEGLIVVGRASAQHASCTISATIAGEGGLSLGGATVMHNNSSKLTLSGANTYTGGTRIDGITVNAASAGAFSSDPVHIRGGYYNGGRVRFKKAATYGNEWYVGGVGTYLYAEKGQEPGCLVFCADVTLEGPVHVERFARFSTSPGEAGMDMSYHDNRSGTGVFAGEISGGEVQLVASHPSAYTKKPIVFTHANSYTGGTIVANQDLILRGKGDCGTGRIVLANGGTLTVSNTVEKTFSGRLEGKGWVTLAGTKVVHFAGGVCRESWCDLKLELAGTSPIFTETPPFGVMTNSAAQYASVTLRGSMDLDPATYDWLDPNVRVTVDGGEVDLHGGTITVERVYRRNGGRFVNGHVIETKPVYGLGIIVR